MHKTELIASYEASRAELLDQARNQLSILRRAKAEALMKAMGQEEWERSRNVLHEKLERLRVEKAEREVRIVDFSSAFPVTRLLPVCISVSMSLVYTAVFDCKARLLSFVLISKNVVSVRLQRRSAFKTRPSASLASRKSWSRKPNTKWRRSVWRSISAHSKFHDM
jgi:hypothetical protein